MKYLQQLWDKILVKNTAFLGSTEGSQIMGSKYKKITLGNKERQQLSKKAKGKQLGKYCRDTGIKIGGANFCKRYVYGSVRHSSHWGGSLQNGLRDEWTCRITLASAYMLHCLSVT